MGREELGDNKIIIPSSEQEESEHSGVTQADKVTQRTGQNHCSLVKVSGKTFPVSY